MANNNKKGGLDWLVASRGYAMLGVFLGHLLITYPPDEKFVAEMLGVGQFLEPTFVPFFAIMAGAFFSRGNQGFADYAKLKFTQRVIPVWLYLLLIIPFYLLLPLPEKTAMDSLKMIPSYLLGIPYLSWPSWFLIALFTGEMLYYFIQPHARGTRRTLLLALLFYSVAWCCSRLTYHADMLRLLTMIWMIQASLLFCAFFLIGMLARPYMLKMSRWSRGKTALLMLPAMAVLFVATLLNKPHFIPAAEGSFFSFVRSDMMSISFGQYGHYVWFGVSMLSAALMLLCLCRIIPVTRFMRSCGDHSLVLIGLNGIFLNVLNERISVWLVNLAGNQAMLMLLFYVLMALLTMAICLPVAIVLEKYLPQLTGKPMLKGPLLPALYRKA